MSTEPLLLMPKHAAELLNTSEKSLVKLTKSGAIKCVQLGKRGRRYDVESLKAFIKKRLSSSAK